MEAKTPYSTTVRRNPPRKARPTPSSAVHTSSPPQNISSFPIEEILSMDVPEKQPSSSSESLKVFLRIRPFVSQKNTVAETRKTKIKNAWPKNPKSTNTVPKKLKSNEACVIMNDAHSVTVSPPPSLQETKRTKSEVYEGFSQVFSSEASQREVYEKMVNPLAEDFLKGRSGMLAALGPSGSGKTHTFFGCTRDPGVVPLALRQILSKDQADSVQSQRTFYLSMFEISSEKGKPEKIFDLSQDGADLCIQQTSIKGMREAVLYDAQQAESLLARGLLKRATAMTNSNSQSSRSQCIINIRWEYKKIDGKVGDNSNGAVLTIVDLAGAEREKKTGNQGVRLLESNFINNTSMVFGLCLRSLLEHQKNRKRPMQKHFQNSLLTRYLRDYLEGKKRMALLLTVRPGEEDYLDTSHWLRQASPYTKIKFDVIEEQGNLNHNKRHVQAMPTPGQLKRMKLSRSETCEINQGSDKCIQLLNEEAGAERVKDDSLTDVVSHSDEIINVKGNERNSPLVDNVDLERKERYQQILENIGIALLKVSREYKRKFEVAENEICSLKECLTNEKKRSAELENELRDWRSNYCCRGGVSNEVSSREVDEFRIKSSLEFKEHQEKSEVYSCLLEGSEHTKNEGWLGSTQVKNFIEDATGVEDLKDLKDVNTENTHLNDKDSAVLSGSPSCTDQEFERQEEHSVSISQAIFIHSDEKAPLKEDQPLFHSVVPECTVVSSVSSFFVENPVGEDQTPNKEDKDSQQHQNYTENSSDVGDAKLPEDLKAESTHLDDEETAILSGSPFCTDKEYGLQEESSVSISQSTFSSQDETGPMKEDNPFFHSALSECAIVSSESSLFIENQVEEDQTFNEEDKKSMGPSTVLIPEVVVNAGDPETVAEHVKPKRRLAPAPSLLFKDIGSIDFKDENKIPKGVKTEKKAAGGKRTQGSISLLCMLKDNHVI